MRLISMFYPVVLVLICSLSQAQTSDEIWEYYSNRDFANAIKYGQQALQNDSLHPNINLTVGRALYDSGKCEEAIPYLMKGTVETDNPAWIQAWSYHYLGRAYYYTSNPEEAKKYFLKSKELNATPKSVHYTKSYLKLFQTGEFFDSWEIVEKQNIRFHFQNKSNINDPEAYMDAREEAYEKINEFFAAKPYKKIDFYVWDKPEDAKQYFGRELGFADPYQCVINSRVNQTRGHEITHVLCYIGIPPVNRRKLIDEGIAVYFDQSNRNRMAVAKESLESKEIDLVDLWNNPKNYPNTFNYTIGGAWINFLMKNGSEEQLKALLKDQSVEGARKIYNDFDELVVAFEKELKQ